MRTLALGSALALLALAAGCRGGTPQGREDSPAVQVARAAPGPAGGVLDPLAPGTAPEALLESATQQAAAPESQGAGDSEPPSPQDATEEQQPALLAALAGSDASAQRTAAEALARLGTPAAAAALAPHAVPGDPLEAVAVAGIGWAGGPAHADRLLAALRSTDAEARSAAAIAIGAAATAHWDRPLAFALQVDRPEVKAVALTAIGLAGRTTLLPDVAQLSRDKDPVVREAAFDALRRLPLPGAALLLAEAGQSTALPPSEDPAPPPCPLMPGDSAALEALLADPSAPIVERALAAVALGRQGRTVPLAAAGSTWPRLVRAAALLARHAAGDPLPPEDVALERRALEVGRLAHPALAHPLDACLRLGDQGAPLMAAPKEEP